MYHIAGSNAVGSTLNITQINREHMGTYVCEANNGIPPSALQEFDVQVHCKHIFAFYNFEHTVSTRMQPQSWIQPLLLGY